MVPAGGKAIVKTGLAIAIPQGSYARIAPRSGLAAKHMINTGAGVVDYDYRGEVGVVLFNHGPSNFDVQVGDRIAQLILEKVCMVGCVQVEQLDETARGSGGFGSTGVVGSAGYTGGTGAMQEGAPDAMQVRKLTASAALPVRGSEHAAGFDLSAAEAAVVPAGGKAIVKTGLAIAIPANTYARIAPRSGLAAKHMIHVGAGVVDYDYRGEVGVVLFNHGTHDFPVAAGDRIAQLILEEISMAGCVEVDSLDETSRGEGGFGSTGISEQVASTPMASRKPRDDAETPEKVTSPISEIDLCKARIEDLERKVALYSSFMSEQEAIKKQLAVIHANVNY
eukprot:TRINITY_DN91493_c0_g1_i1.p1 TRINITY_DN91493_c0_g1~~TRINITY_DN91493_c0_g1_i1.p1  ORF type:complete len:383 (+),score=93.74 TRINITY_DN91493_c0_g1_i1:140-1150(+)